MPTPIDISASRGAGILGVSPYASQVEIWLEIMEARKSGFCAEHGYTLSPPPDNIAIDWGLAFEDAIVDLAEREQGSKIVNREQLIQQDYLSCHIDGQYDKLNCLHEGKTTSIYYFWDNFGVPGSDQIPMFYTIQVQHQMMLKEIDKNILSVLVFPKRQSEFKVNVAEIDCMSWAEMLYQMGFFYQYKISANKILQDKMKIHYEYFWENYVLKEIAPPPTKYSDIALLVNNPQGVISADEQVEEWAKEYKQLNAEKLISEKRKDFLKTSILNYMIVQDRDVEKILNDNSRTKWILQDRTGKKLFQYNGKIFR
ncbi:MAG: YqaJ viral recombinase family protein [Victivallales bacterium]|nr:YqaJ viral recombinase family protein [Victivallales bacterium]